MSPLIKIGLLHDGTAGTDVSTSAICARTSSAANGLLPAFSTSNPVGDLRAGWYEAEIDRLGQANRRVEHALDSVIEVLVQVGERSAA